MWDRKSRLRFSALVDFIDLVFYNRSYSHLNASFKRNTYQIDTRYLLDIEGQDKNAFFWLLLLLRDMSWISACVTQNYTEISYQLYKQECNWEAKGEKVKMNASH